MDPEIDFRELFSQFDTMLLGRGTYEAALERRGVADYGMRTYVFSRTLRQKDHSEVTVVADQANELLTALKKAPGKDIWLMGGRYSVSLSAKPGRGRHGRGCHHSGPSWRGHSDARAFRAVDQAAVDQSPAVQEDGNRLVGVRGHVAAA
jgi:hypothetical protein